VPSPTAGLRRTLAALCVGLAATGATFAQEAIDAPSKGQTVYVPVYSEVRYGNLNAAGKADTELMSVLVSIRNTDPKEAIRVVAAPYYDTAGRMIRDYLPTPRTVAPFGTLELFVEHRESDGGSGANFAIRWEAAKAVSPPIVEALHLRVQSGRTLGFVSRGKPISAP
jgi:hypothetical protein